MVALHTCNLSRPGVNLFSTMSCLILDAMLLVLMSIGLFKKRPAKMWGVWQILLNQVGAGTFSASNKNRNLKWNPTRPGHYLDVRSNPFCSTDSSFYGTQLEYANGCGTQYAPYSAI